MDWLLLTSTVNWFSVELLHIYTLSNMCCISQPHLDCSSSCSSRELISRWLFWECMCFLRNILPEKIEKFPTRRNCKLVFTRSLQSAPYWTYGGGWGATPMWYYQLVPTTVTRVVCTKSPSIGNPLIPIYQRLPVINSSSYWKLYSCNLFQLFVLNNVQIIIISCSWLAYLYFLFVYC